MAWAVIYAVMYWAVGLHCSHWCARGDRKGSMLGLRHQRLAQERLKALMMAEEENRRLLREAGL